MGTHQYFDDTPTFGLAGVQGAEPAPVAGDEAGAENAE